VARIPKPRLRAALESRLTAAAEVLLPGFDASQPSTMRLLRALVDAVTGDDSQLWLLMSCVGAQYPTRTELVAARRALELAEPAMRATVLLEVVLPLAAGNPLIDRDVRIVQDTVLVDVDFCAHHGHNTGVQRVVRETMARWDGVRPHTLLAWSEDGGSYRELSPEEHSRVVAWTSQRRLEHSQGDAPGPLIVPWQCSLLLPEVAPLRVWERLAALAEFSRSPVVAVGYDAIPVTSSAHVVPNEVDRFVRYLSVLKSATLVVGISESSSREFAGFASALQAQGMAGPRTETILLPVDVPAESGDADALPSRRSRLPLVVCVGTQEPRKNQLAVLSAAELLWSRGMQFELQFIGGAAYPLSVSFDQAVDSLRRRGRPVSVKRNVSDAILARAYRDAAFSVFVSQHEGFGLPVGESLAFGTPAITTAYGSMSEIAAGGGCLTVDPRDDVAIADAMTTLLIDPEVSQRLRREAAERASRTWDDYAHELWAAMERVA
jgi:glycosyltransferase involved in cell wall biosynthesis